MTLASIIIPVRGRIELLTRGLSLLDAIDRPDFEILVVADHCPEAVAALAERDLRHPCRLYALSGSEEAAPFGAAQARNLGARFAAGELLIFLDADCLAGSDHVQGFVDAAAPDTLLLGPIDYVDAADWTRPLASELRPIFDPGAEPPPGVDEATWRGSLCWTGNMAVSRTAFIELGGFDLAFMGAGGEDADFGLRFAARHGRVALAKSRVRHAGPTAAFAHLKGEPGPLDNTGVSQRMADGRYDGPVAELVANGGPEYFADETNWRGVSDLRAGRVPRRMTPAGKGDSVTDVLQEQFERGAAALLAIARRLDQERPLDGAEEEFLALFRSVVAADPRVFSEVWSDPQAQAWVRPMLQALQSLDPDSDEARAAFAVRLAGFTPFALACAYLGGQRLELATGLLRATPWAIPGTRFTVESDGLLEVRGISASALHVAHPETGAAWNLSLSGEPSPAGCPGRIAQCETVEWHGEEIRFQPAAFRTPEGIPPYVVAESPGHQPGQGALLIDALEIVEGFSPEVAELAEWIRVVTFNPPELAALGNTSSSDSPGALALLGHEDAWELADTLVHELRHQWLFAFELRGELFSAAEQNAAKDFRYYSPWRMDPRPIKGIFHGFYVFVGVARHWLAILEERPAPSQAVLARARGRLAELTLQMEIARETIASHAELSPPGLELFEELSEGLDQVRSRIEALGVPVQGTEAARRVETQQECFDPARLLARLGPTLNFDRRSDPVLGADGSGELPRISALCVTRGRVALLERAVACFRTQTHPNRELVVLYEDDDLPTESFVTRIAESVPELVVVRVPRVEPGCLGELRNLAVSHATGEYVCQWDDDDWHHPERMEAQWRAIRESGQAACVLSRWLIFDADRRRAYLSPHRHWEGSLLCRRDRMPAYPPLGIGEDTPVVMSLWDGGDLLALERPDLYVYVGHGGNTWTPGHFDTFFQEVFWLGAERSAEVAEALEKGAG